MANVVQDYINASLRKLGVLSEGETPTIFQSNAALFALNTINDQWQAERGKMPAVVNTVGTLTPSKGTYTVGPGGDINIARPEILDHVSYINNNVSPAIELPLEMLTSDVWAAVPVKTLTGSVPYAYYYDYAFSASGLANLSFWLIPTTTNLQYSLYVPTPFATFATLQTAVLLPPAYWRMLVNKLAIEIAPEYATSASQDVKDAAAEAEEMVLQANTHPLELNIEPGALIQGSGGRNRWSIFTGP